MDIFLTILGFLIMIGVISNIVGYVKKMKYEKELKELKKK